MRDKIRGNSQSYFDVNKLERLAKKASEKAIGQATAYLWKVTVNSIKRRSGKEKKYDLKIFLGQREDGTYETVENAKKYLARAKRANEKIVQRNKRDVRTPNARGKYREKTPSAPGQPPRSHKTSNHWLKNQIRMIPTKGVVFVNPAERDDRQGRSKTIPLLLEEGGLATSHVKILEGYYAHKKYFKNGKVSVRYRPVYSHKTKKYRAQARPFLVPALIQAASKLLEILKNSIK